MEGMKKCSKKENDDLIALMLDVGIDMPFSPELTKTRLSKEAVDKCIAAVYATLVIPHPTADDQLKCVACKTMVALHMMMPKNLATEKIHELDICNTCMLVAEAEGVIFIDNPASCRCLAARHGNCLDCSSCYIKKTGKRKDRCNMQQVWCRPWNRFAIVGNDKGVDDLKLLFLQHMQNTEIMCY